MIVEIQCSLVTDKMLLFLMHNVILTVVLKSPVLVFLPPLLYVDANI